MRELEVWFKSIANLALFEEGQPRGTPLYTIKYVDNIGDMPSHHKNVK